MGEFVTGEAARERFRALSDQVDAAHAEMRALSSDGVGTAFRVELAERWETQERTNRALMYRMFGQIADPPDETAMAPMVVNSLAARLRIAPSEAKRRMRVAARIQPRRQLTGPALAPELPLVAAALEAGTIGEDHLRVICRALDTLPSCVSPMGSRRRAGQPAPPGEQKRRRDRQGRRPPYRGDLQPRQSGCANRLVGNVERRRLEQEHDSGALRRPL